MPSKSVTEASLTAALCAKVASLQNELAHLRQRYDALLEAKEEAEEKCRMAVDKQGKDLDSFKGFRTWVTGALKEGKYDEILRVARSIEEQVSRDAASSAGQQGKTEEKDRGKATGKAEKRAETRALPASTHLDSDARGAGMKEEVKAKTEDKEEYNVLGDSSAINAAPHRPSTPPKPPDFRDPHLLSTPGRTSAPAGHSTPSPVASSSKHIAVSAPNTPIKSEPQSQPQSVRHHSPASHALAGPSRTEKATTINSAFMINPDANGGHAYAYDTVVRKREERRHMEGGDCECCRAYYEGVGPMPPRLQPPPWRSPSTTPRKKKQKQKERFGASRTEPRQRPYQPRPYPSPHRDRTHRSPSHHHPSASASASASGSGLKAVLSASGGSPSRRKRRDSFDDPIAGSDEEAENSRRDIEAHKKAISKHRYHWQRAKTPPGYWDIGFPSTQEADALNERASAMHRDKMRAVEREAARGNGRYVKRKP